MKYKTLQWFSMALIFQLGLIHLYLAPHMFADARYLGVLFIANFIVALISAIRIYSDETWGWTLGLLISAASAAGYIWSRTIGLPGMQPENWADPLGVMSLFVETAFILLFLIHMRWSRAENQVFLPQTPNPGRSGLLIPAAAFAMVVVISLFGFKLDTSMTPAGVPRTTSITQEDLADAYGISVSQASITAMDSIIDLRLRIFDAKKAGYLLGNPNKNFYLLVGDHPAQVILPARTGHHAHVVRSGGVYIMFFPNPRNSLTPGTPVSLVFGDLRLDSIVLK
jgi:hypothetical protein